MRFPVVLALGAFAASCARHPAASKTTPTSADIATERWTAALVITRARCAHREFTCTYTSRDECVAAELRATEAALGLDRCEGGIDERQIDACAEALRGEPCGGDLATIDACAPTKICVTRLAN